MRASAEERFWQKVDVSGDCWLWTAGVDRNGYGWFRGEGRSVFAHRFAYELLVAPIPGGLVLDHLCRQTRCVRPAHLEPVSIAENVRRGFALIPSREVCRNGHAITEANSIARANGRVKCRECQRDAQRRYADRHKTPAATAAGQ